MRENFETLLLLALCWLVLALVYERKQPIVCHAGTERAVNSADEYPAWQLECDGGRTVVLVD